MWTFVSSCTVHELHCRLGQDTDFGFSEVSMDRLGAEEEEEEECGAGERLATRTTRTTGCGGSMESVSSDDAEVGVRVSNEGSVKLSQSRRL